MTLSGSARRVVQAGFVIVVTLLVAQAICVVPAVRSHLGAGWQGDASMAGALYMSTALLVLLRAVLIRKERGAWLMLGCALLSYAAGNVYWYALAAYADPGGYARVADVLWILSYPCFCLALLRLLRSRMPRLRTVALLDGLIAAAGAAAFAALPFLSTVVIDSRTSVVTLAVNLSYPVADTVLVGCLLGSWAMTGWRTDPLWLLLLTGMALFAVADCVYLLQLVHGTYVVGTWLDGLWHAGVAAMAAAAWIDDRPTRKPGRLRAGGLDP